MEGEPVTIDSLPTELLAQIFSYLTEPPPSTSRLHDQPEPHLLRSEHQDLKNLSLVSRRWRAISLPVLFRHVQWSFDRWDLLAVEPAQESDPVAALPPLAFLRANDLGRHVESLTLMVSDSLQGMWRLAEAGSSPDAPTFSSARSAMGSTSGSSSRHGDLFDNRSDQGEETRHPDIATRAATYNEQNNWVWEMLFGLMDPRQLNIIASPRILASLLSRMLFLGDSWSFKDQCHVLSISRESGKGSARATVERALESAPAGDSSDSAPGLRQRASTEKVQCNNRGMKRVPCNLFTIRPWTSILLNEGSSTRVYKTYEFFLKRPPSILGALLGAEEFPNDRPLIPSTIRSLAYVAIFPLSSHFNTLVRSLPPLDRLFVQLVPRNDILQNPEEMRNVLTSDLWMERNTCYSMVMRELLTGSAHENDMEEFGDGFAGAGGAHTRNWRNLREFESGDAADKDAWDMAVQYVRMSRTGWRVEREGVFVRAPQSQRSSSSDSQSEPADEVASDAEGGSFEIFQDKLERLAFSGTAHLPYSPAHQYGAGAGDWDNAIEVEVDVTVVDTGIPGVHALTTTWEGVVGAVLDNNDWEDHYDPW
ncbi:hypothetical protein GQ53DRAFT_743653 [Thozetella sp. PMI_491]|nr:hypothetical protein GQ53DRAFT_743653 [Thozetella sp. PMI_491]